MTHELTFQQEIHVEAFGEGSTSETCRVRATMTNGSQRLLVGKKRVDFS
jgi:hypothetical protein